MKNREKLDEFTESILRYLQNNSATQDKLIAQFSSKIYNENTIRAHIHVLENKNYIKKQDRIVGAFGGSEDDLLREINVYIITPLGQNYLANASSSHTTFSNITNSNIAHQSSNVTQSISISEQPQDIQEKIKELEEAIAKKDSSGMKRAFGYIADKAVDVTIAIATGRILQ